MAEPPLHDPEREPGRSRRAPRTRSAGRPRPAPAPRAERPAPAAPARAPTAPGPDADLQTLLFHAVQGLRQETGARSAVAWTRREDGVPVLVAADYEGEPPPPPERAEIEALALAGRAVSLGEPGQDPAVRRLGRRHGMSAGAVVVADAGQPAAALLVDAPAAPNGAVRPRALAALAAAARRLATPVAAAAALRRLEAMDRELRRVDRLASLGSLVAEIAHEVRNPLVSVKTFVQLLPERRGDEAFVSHFLDVADEEVRRMERLLDLLVEQGRPPADGDGPAAAGPAVEAVAGLLRQRARKRGISVECEVAPELPELAVSEDRLRQVLLNLGLNAVDASPEDGTVRIAASLAEDGGGVGISLRDAGPGIPEALRERVFEPYFTTRSDRPGGLGLAIARRIVEEAGGEIAVADAEAGGAEFRLRLPTRGALSVEAPESAPRRRARSGGRRRSRRKRSPRRA